MKDYIEERAIQIANYIIENNVTVRQTAKEFVIRNLSMKLLRTVYTVCIIISRE